MRFLFLLFIIVPIIEITVLIQVGQAIGAWYTVGLVLLSAFIGVNMLRHQGLSTLARAQQRMGQGEVPGQEMVEGIVLAVGGALLVTPGFVTDVVGFSCLVPAVRRGVVKALLGRFTLVAASHSSTHAFHQEYRSVDARHDVPRRDGDVIDGEFERRD
ncbi:FxsA family protein [Marinobacterium marinum]|uniref:Membrane protein FxsA n=1 Tax=Marinobacterium marinum TaxID=2756129 RepID=A0A7W2ADE2_9GAMM|nr:membrane protein FxsA [Marinobacterium marinum]